MIRTISLKTNGTKASDEAKHIVINKFHENGFNVRENTIEGCELLVCIGGDGALLNAVQAYDFPDIPIVGVNTGHLGFFQELSPEDPDELDQFIKEYKEGRFRLQPLNTVQATVTLQDGTKQIHKSLNEIVIKGLHSHSVHLDISIGDSPIENFSGDGILVATSAGSTAYNYSLGGSIVDPRLKLLQVTPIAPMNTTAYRSFTSSILLPAELSIGVVPEENETHRNNRLTLLNDGDQNIYMNVQDIKIEFSDSIINLVRFADYNFWGKVKTKFLQD